MQVNSQTLRSSYYYGDGQRGAKEEDFKRIIGPDTGADDYVVKPFSPLRLWQPPKTIMKIILENKGI